MDFETVFKISVNELYFLSVEVMIKNKLMVSIVIRLLLMWLANYCKEPDSIYGIVGCILPQPCDSECFCRNESSHNDM